MTRIIGGKYWDYLRMNFAWAINEFLVDELLAEEFHNHHNVDEHVDETVSAIMQLLVNQGFIEFANNPEAENKMKMSYDFKDKMVHVIEIHHYADAITIVGKRGERIEFTPNRDLHYLFSNPSVLTEKLVGQSIDCIEVDYMERVISLKNNYRLVASIGWEKEQEESNYEMEVKIGMRRQ